MRRPLIAATVALAFVALAVPVSAQQAPELVLRFEELAEVLPEHASITFLLEGLQPGDEPTVDLTVGPADFAAPGNHVITWTPGGSPAAAGESSEAMDGETDGWSQEATDDGWRVTVPIRFPQDGSYELSALARVQSPSGDLRVQQATLAVAAETGRWAHMVEDRTKLPTVMNHTQQVPFDVLVQASFTPEAVDAILLQDDWQVMSAAEANIEVLEDGSTIRLTGWIDYAPFAQRDEAERQGASGNAALRLTFQLRAPIGTQSGPAYASGEPVSVRILEDITHGAAPEPVVAPSEPEPQPISAPPAVPIAGGLAAVAVASLVGATEWGRYAFLRVPLAGLAVGRVAKGEVLAHRRRARLYAAIQEQPGVGFGQLRRSLGWGNGVLSHHLHVLERTGHVRVARRGARLHFVDASAPANRAVLPETQQAILSRLEAGWRGSQAALAADLGISRQAIHAHVRQLEAAGHIQVDRSGGATTLSPSLPGQIHALERPAHL